MAKDYLESYVAIEPYQSGFDMEFNKLELRTSYWKGYGAVINVQPVYIDEQGGKQCMMMCFNPIEDGMEVKRIPMARKNAKQLEAIYNPKRIRAESLEKNIAKQLENIHKDLCGMGGMIADLWNKRDFEGIKGLFS